MLSVKKNDYKFIRMMRNRNEQMEKKTKKEFCFLSSLLQKVKYEEEKT